MHKCTGYNSIKGFFDIIRFSNFTAAEVRLDRDFWVKLNNFLQKMPTQRTSAAVKLEKRKISKYPLVNF